MAQSKKNEKKSIKSLFIEAISICERFNEEKLNAYRNIPDTKKRDARNNFKISLNDEIFFIRDTSFWQMVNQGMVITDLEIIFIDDNDKPDDIEKYKWKDIHHVEYKDLNLYFFLLNENAPLEVCCDYFFKLSDNHRKNERRGKFLADVFTGVAQLAGNPDDPFDGIEKIEKLIDDRHYDEALIECDKYKQEKEDNILIRITYADIFLGKQDYTKALQKSFEVFDIIDKSNNILNNANLYSYIYNQRAKIYEKLEKFDEARKDFANAMIKTLDQECKTENKKHFQRMDSIYINSFFKMKYSKRKLLIVVDEINNLSPKNISVLDINNLPDILFPIGHPIANHLYVGHPYIVNKYIPFEEHEIELIEDRIREFCEIMQYLGALEIKIETINAKGEKEFSEVKNIADVNAGYKIIEGKIVYDNTKQNDFVNSIRQSITLSQTFSPIQKPKLPP